MTLSNWITLLVTFAVAVMSPGPDFLATLRMSLTRGRRKGIATGLGIGTGTSLWAVGTMVGIVAIISASQAVFFVVRLAGATFLAVYGARILWSVYKSHRDRSNSISEGEPAAPQVEGELRAQQSESSPAATAQEGSAPTTAPAEDYPWWKAFRLGFLTTTVGNPKAVIFFTTLFAAMLPSEITATQGALLTASMVLISSAWFTIVASVASIPAFVRGYEKMHTPIDVALGGLFVILGVALIPWSTVFA
ncbi:MAG: LysE family transporter [Actinomycetaceae bacterium]|nr:LysE family transporter [Actinomycetaceae bacterium]